MRNTATPVAASRSAAVDGLLSTTLASCRPNSCLWQFQFTTGKCVVGGRLPGDHSKRSAGLGLRRVSDEVLSNESVQQVASMSLLGYDCLGVVLMHRL